MIIYRCCFRTLLTRRLCGPDLFSFYALHKIAIFHFVALTAITVVYILHIGTETVLYDAWLDKREFEVSFFGCWPLNCFGGNLRVRIGLYCISSLLKVSIFNMLGKLVLEATDPLSAIDLKELSLGMHLVKIETSQGTLHKTILKK